MDNYTLLLTEIESWLDNWSMFRKKYLNTNVRLNFLIVNHCIIVVLNVKCHGIYVDIFREWNISLKKNWWMILQKM